MLSIVIPACNESAAIGGVVRACLDAAASIREAGGLDSVEIVVVDDGSTDRTAEIVTALADAEEAGGRVRLVSHDTNRGYGAALMTGFRASRGDLLAFLDGDGTCDPREFAGLVAELNRTGADIAVGARLGPGTKMPLVRRMGNRFFALLLRVLSGNRMSDTASGQRVFRRSILAALEGLPRSLSFTPAMSARAAFDPGVTLVERPVSYGARTGSSKLGVFADGWRFLRVILDTALSYRPGPFFGAVAALLWAVALGYGIGPLAHYARTRTVPQENIQRLLAVLAAGIAGQVFFLSGIVSQRLALLIHGIAPGRPGALGRVVRWAVAALPGARAVVLELAEAALLVPPVIRWLGTGSTGVHWSLMLTGLFFFLAGAVYAAYWIQDRMISRWERRSSSGPPRTTKEKTVE